MSGKIYMAGPMTGLPDFNYPAFHAAEKRWTEAGWWVLNPATHFGGDQSLPYVVYLRAALRTVTFEADAIALLDGWRGSKGACAEAHVAAVLDLPFYDAETMARIATPGLFCQPTL